MASRRLIFGFEAGSAERFAWQQTEHDLNLVEPTGGSGRKVKLDSREQIQRSVTLRIYAVWRVLRREGIYPRRLRSWCVSTDKEFGPKAAEVVGLSLNPPLNAVC